MVDPIHQEALSSPSAESVPDREKVRLRFRKGGDLRFLGHHDLLRCFERMLRRARLPFSRTQGFNPRPRLTFALSLPLGVIGCEEVLEIVLEPGALAAHPVEKILQSLQCQAPPGLEILSICQIPFKVKAQVRALTYRLVLPDGSTPVDLPDLIERALGASEIPFIRRAPTKNQRGEKTTSLDLRPFLKDLRLQENNLEIDLWLLPTGTARPVEILQLLNLQETYEAGAILERSRLELYDEHETPSSSEMIAERITSGRTG